MRVFHFFFFTCTFLASLLSFLKEKNWLFSKESLLEKVRFSTPQEDKHFTFIIPAFNCVDVCEKTLHSIFSQTYPHFNVQYIDNGSTDETASVVQEYIDRYNVGSKLQVTYYQENRGAVERFYEMAYSCKEEDILIFLKGNAWLSHKEVLQELNDLYKKFDLWLIYAFDQSYTTQEIQSYPGHKTALSALRRTELGHPRFKSFYAGLFKKIKLEDFFFRGEFVTDSFDEAYLIPMLEMAGPHATCISKPLCHYIRKHVTDNKKPCYLAPFKCKQKIRATPPYLSLSIPPYQKTPSRPTTSDLLIFSFDRPMQLYALLESIQRHITGIEEIWVIYRTSTERYKAAYDALKQDFPQVHFEQQNSTASSFKQLVLQTLYQKMKSPYIFFAVDDMVVKDTICISEAISYLQATQAYFFSFRLGENINYCYMGGFSQEIPLHLCLEKKVFAWQIDSAKGDWNYANSLDMTLYRKQTLKKTLETISFQNPNELEWHWTQAKSLTKHKKKRVGLCYSSSKALNIPLNLVNPSKNKHMNLYSPEDLLHKFEQNFLINIDPLYQIENESVHMEYEPSFIPKKKATLKIATLRKEGKEKSLPFGNSKSQLDNTK